MLSLLSDENLNGDIIRGLFLRQPNLDLIRVQDVGLIEVEDPAILAWAAESQRIILTHDRATMPDFAYERLVRGKAMLGMFVINDRMPIRQAIDELLLLIDCTEQEVFNSANLENPIFRAAFLATSLITAPVIQHREH
jgi:predicted nuclease of predicted toxin-antitoxin system